MRDDFDRSIGGLLAEDTAQTERRTERACALAGLSSRSNVVVFGAGQLGRFLVPALRSASVETLAFCDNNQGLWGTSIDGVPVLSPSEAVEHYGSSKPFVVGVYNGTAVCRQLGELGCRWIVRYPLLFWKYAEFIPDERLCRPQQILSQADEMRPAYDLLSDEESRMEFRAQIRWRCLLDYGCLPLQHSPAEMYFPPDLLALLPDDVFVDCGAFDGDTIRSFLARSNGHFRHIYAFEPDAANVKNLRAYVAALADSVESRVSVLPYAIGRANGTVQFNAEGSVGSKVVDSGGTAKIECRTLDSALGEETAATYIKMDIEGAEVDAIPGARKTIERFRPVIAACAYHRPEHLWTIPKLLKEVNPDYRIYLRRYAEECWETVYYAIPPERLRAPAPGRAS